jgi:hypothetical protein
MASEVIATIRSEHSVRRRAAFKLLYSIEAERNANRTEIARAHDKLRDNQLNDRRQSFYRDYRDPRYNWTDRCCSSWCKGNPEEFNFLDDEYESLSDKHQIVSDNITSDQKRTDEEVLKIQQHEVAFRAIAEEVAFKAKQREVKRITEEAKRRKVEMWKFRMICAFLCAATAWIVHYCLEYQHNHSASITTT